MITLTIIGIIIIIILGFGAYIINSHRPKFFTGELKPLVKTLINELKKNLNETSAALITNHIKNLIPQIDLKYKYTGIGKD